MTIGILLAGKVVDGSLLPADRQLQGLDLWGNTKIFDKDELVNNLQTVAAISEALPHATILVRHVISRNSPLQLYRQIKATQRWIIENKINLVHQFWGGPGALSIAYSTKVPLVLSLLGSDLMGSYNASGQPNLKGKLLRWCSIAASKKASRIIVMSAKMKAALPPELRSKASIIPEGIDLQKFSPLDKQTCRAKLGWAPQERVVLFFDNGNRVKNAPLAREVVRLASERIRDLRLQTVSGIAHHLLPLYYNAADCLLITSLHEGSNNSLKEAMACNCPVVSTNVGDAAERLAVVNPSGIAEINEPEKLALLLADILQSGLRSNGAAAAHEVSNQHLAQQYVRLYHELLES
jgi:glycosyltransferase involved in cell wall biosynthesis